MGRNKATTFVALRNRRFASKFRLFSVKITFFVFLLVMETKDAECFNHKIIGHTEKLCARLFEAVRSKRLDRAVSPDLRQWTGPDFALSNNLGSSMCLDFFELLIWGALGVGVIALDAVFK